MAEDFTAKKAEAAAWFRSLRDQIVASFEGLEDRFGQGTPGRFEVTPTVRADGGGGLMSVMRGGRVFEKVGVNVSEVHGTLGERAQKAMAARGVPGMDKDPRFWASGISLVAHMVNPHCPAVHMNTRMFWTPHAWWFGGGADLNPCIEYPEDTAHFHAQMQAACDAPGARPRQRPDPANQSGHLAGQTGGTRQLCGHTPAPALKTGHPRNDNCSCSGNKKGHPMGGLFAGIKKLRSIPKRIKRGREEKRFGRNSSGLWPQRLRNVKFGLDTLSRQPVQ